MLGSRELWYPHWDPVRCFPDLGNPGGPAVEQKAQESASDLTGNFSHHAATRVQATGYFRLLSSMHSIRRATASATQLQQERDPEASSKPPRHCCCRFSRRSINAKVRLRGIPKNLACCVAFPGSNLVQNCGFAIEWRIEWRDWVLPRFGKSRDWKISRRFLKKIKFIYVVYIYLLQYLEVHSIKVKCCLQRGSRFWGLGFYSKVSWWIAFWLATGLCFQRRAPKWSIWGNQFELSYELRGKECKIRGAFCESGSTLDFVLNLRGRDPDLQYREA